MAGLDDLLSGGGSAASSAPAGSLDALLGGGTPTAPVVVTKKGVKVPTPAPDAEPKFVATAEPVDPNSLSAGLQRGIDNTLANVGGTGEAIGEVTGLKGLAKASGEYRDQKLKEAAALGEATDSYKKVDSVKDAVDYAENTATGAAPSMGAIMGAGWAAGKVAPGFAKVPAAITASLLASLGINLGDVQNQMKQIDPEAKAGLTSLLTGTGVSILDTAGAGFLMKPLMKTLGKDVATQVMLHNGVPESVVKGALEHAAKSAAVEGATGAATAGASYAGAVGQADAKIDPDKLLENMINGGIGSALAGSVAGAYTGAVSAARHNELTPGSGKPVADSATGPLDKIRDALGLEDVLPNSDKPRSGLRTALESLGSSSLNLLEPLARHSTEARDFVESFRPDMTGATASKQTIFEDAKTTAGQWHQRLEDIKEEAGGIDGFNKALEDYQDNAVPTTPAAIKFKQFMYDVHTEAKTRGKLVDIGKIDRFLPISADPKRVEANKDAFIADIMPSYGNDRQKASDAVDLWLEKSKQAPDQVPNINRNVTIDPATGELQIAPAWRKDANDSDTMKYKFSQGQIPPANSHLEKQRAFAQVPQKILTSWSAQTEPGNVVGNAKRAVTGDARQYHAVADYLEGAAHRIAFSSRFGPAGEIANARIAKSVRQAQAAGYRPKKEEVDRMFDQLDAYNGMLNPVQNTALKHTMAGVGAAMTLKTLPLAGLAGLSELMTPAIRGDVGSAIKGVFPTIYELGRGTARRMFNGIPKTEFATMAADSGNSLSQATNVAAQRIGATGLTRATAGITKNFFLANGLTLMTHATRTYAAKVGSIVMDKHLQNLAAGVPLTSQSGMRSLAMLRSMGVNIRSQAEAQALWAPSTRSEAENARQIKVDAMHRFASQSVIEPSSADTPMWMSDNRLHLLAMLHRYPAAFTNTILPQIVRRMGPGWNGGSGMGIASGAVGSAFAIGMMVALGSVQDELKMIAKNGDLDYQDTRTPDQRFDDIVNSTVMPVQYTWMADFFNAPRYGQSGFGSLSPTIGAGEDIVKGIYSYGQNPSEGKIYQTLYKQTPFQFYRPGREAAKSLDLF